MNYSFILPVFISFVVSAVLGPVLIPFLRNLKLSQTEREPVSYTHLDVYKRQCLACMQTIIRKGTVHRH